MQGALWPRSITDEPDELRALVALSMVPGIGPGKMRLLISRLGSPSRVMKASSKMLSSTDGIGPQTASAIVGFDEWADVDEQFEEAERINARLIVESSGEYPTLLREIYDPPAYLWVRGEADWSLPSVAIVGTRRATEYGKRVTADLARHFADAGMCVVSGMAYGIDFVAHDQALNNGGATVGVLGSGVDVIYPSTHRALAKRMIEGGGAVISEFPLGAKPDAPNFPRRNRIVSGLTLATIVVEAHEQGGALITAQLALEQNREVYAVPSPLNSMAGVGANALIRDGHARLVTSAEEVIADLNLTRVGEPAVFSRPDLSMDLDGPEQALYEALSDSPIHIDSLCEQISMDSSTALVHLLGLEFKGLIRQMAGKQFLRA
jgi:DNA processing protein